MAGRFTEAPRIRVRALSPLVNAGTDSDVLLELEATAFRSAQWRWSPTAGPAPASGQVRTDTGAWATATTLLLSDLTDAGADVGPALDRLLPDDLVRLQERDDAANWANFTVVAAPVDAGGHHSVAVAHTGGGGVLPANNTPLIVTVGTAGTGAAGPPGPVGPAGPTGPAGPQGLPGTPGVAEVGTQQEILLANYTAGVNTGPGVGRYSRRAGPQQDAHLRAGPAPSSHAFLEAVENAHMTANAYWDGANWLRFDTAQLAAFFGTSLATRGVGLYSAPAGANPVAFNASTSLLHDASGNTIFRAENGGMYIAALKSPHLSANCYWDGANWRRYNTANAASIFVLRDNAFQLDVYYAAPGANPIAAWTAAYTISLEEMARQCNSPRVQCRGGSFSPAHATWTNAPAFTSIDANTGGLAGGTPWNNATRVFTAPMNGQYLFTFSGYFDPSTAGNYRSINLYNSSLAYQYEQSAPPPGPGYSRSLTTSGLFFMVAGETVSPQVYQDTGLNHPWTNRMFSVRYVGQ